MKKLRKNPKDVNPYDLSERSSLLNKCECCGLSKRKKNPKDVNPYDLSERGGLKGYCKC